MLRPSVCRILPVLPPSDTRAIPRFASYQEVWYIRDSATSTKDVPP